MAFEDTQNQARTRVDSRRCPSKPAYKAPKQRDDSKTLARTRRAAIAAGQFGSQVECHSDPQNPKWSTSIAAEEFNGPQSNSSRSACTIVRFRAPASWRLQLRSHSCALWFPQEPVDGLDVAFEYMTTRATRSPSLAVALDATSLVQLGQENSDLRLMVHGKKLYCDALSLLRKELAVPPDVSLLKSFSSHSRCLQTQAYNLDTAVLGPRRYHGGHYHHAADLRYVLRHGSKLRA